MKDFEQWWRDAEIFCGEGGMEAAEDAWNAAIDEAAQVAYKACIDCGISASVALAVSDAVRYT